MALILIVSCVLMLSAFMGAAYAQDAQAVNTLVGVGGGAGGVGGVTGITSLIQSNRIGKTIDGMQGQIGELFSKTNRLAESLSAYTSEKDALFQKFEEFRSEMRTDMREVSQKLDGLQERHHSLMLDLARNTPYHRPPHYQEPDL